MSAAADEDRRGLGAPSKCSGAAPRTSTAAPNAIALVSIRGASRLVAFECHRAHNPMPLRHHSTAMLPEPDPTSHSSSPGRGASAASVTARIDCLVI